MKESTHLLSASQDDWTSWLRGIPHDFHHTAAYHAFAERMGEGRAAMAVYGTPDRFMAWPYLIRQIDEDHADAGSVYGYTGPVGKGLEDEDFRSRAWRAIQNIWREQNLVTVFTPFHPLLGNERVCTDFHGAAEVQGGEILQLGRSVILDLSLDTEARRSGYPRQLRQQIRRAERNGMTVELDGDWSCFDDFISIYLGTMERAGATDRYFFSEVYFHELRDALPKTLHLAVAKIGGVVAGGMLFMVHEGIATAHLLGSDPEHRKFSPSKLVIDRLADISGALGATRMNLGAGRGGREDSLFYFKKDFSEIYGDFHIGRWILDREANDVLTRKAQADGASGTEGFFPAYRADTMTRPIE